MTTHMNRTRTALAALLVIVCAALALAGPAAAKLTGEYARFSQCQFKNPEVSKCIISTTNGGKVILGSKTVPIVNPVPLQGGYTEPNEEGYAKFVAAANGVTLAPVPQPVPGGLAGLVNCKEISNFILKAACEFTFENGLTGLNSTLELARPANEILINENNLGGELGTALKLPIKIRLENPLLGGSCYIGSSSSPVIWNLTSGATSPPLPNKSIHGSVGEINVLEQGSILETSGTELVDNAWAAPGASGCGGVFSFLLDPIVNAAAGLPAAAGRNTAVLVNQVFIGAAPAVRENDENNP